MTFVSWALDPRSLLAAIVLVPVCLGYVPQKSRKVVLVSVGVNCFIYAGVALNFMLTAIVITGLCAAAALALGARVVGDLLRSRKMGTSIDAAPKATTHFCDLRTSPLEAAMTFAGQTMLICLYVQELCFPIHWLRGRSLSMGLWMCGWVAQGVAYTKFGFRLRDEASFWKQVAGLSRDGDLTVAKDDATTTHVAWMEVLFRALLAFFANAVYKTFVWATLPMLVARSAGGVRCMTAVVVAIYVLTLSDLACPVALAIRGGEAPGGEKARCCDEEEDRAILQEA